MRGARLSISIGVAALAALAFVPSAYGVTSMNAQVEFATSPITVGASGLGTLSFTNQSTAGEQTVGGIERIVLEPSCRNPGETPPCTDREPGIFAISNGAGAVGTACQGITFTNTNGQAPFPGSRELTAQTPIPTMPVNSTCVINFTYTALAVPAVDTQIGEPGQDTDQTAVVRPDFGGGPINSETATDFTAVSPAPPPTVVPSTPLVTTPVTPPPTCKKGQKLKNGKCVKKKRKKKKK